MLIIKRKHMDNNNIERKTMRFHWKLLIHVAAMAVAAIMLLWLATFWLDVWTHHGEEVEVPSVKGMHFDEACKTLESDGYEVILQDSLYDGSARPGTVMDQNPREGNHVKHGRTIYLTINALSPRTVVAPSLQDISIRQAKSTLEGLGLTNYVINVVPSDYKDLVLSAICDGKRLLPGARIPLDSRIILEVGEGPLEPIELSVDTDSIAPITDSEAPASQPADDEPDSFFD